MISPFLNCTTPFKLASNIIYFHDWRYVHPGETHWRSEEGEGFGLFTTASLPRLRYEPKWMPRGIALMAQRATKSEPFLLPEKIDAVLLLG